MTKIFSFADHVEKKKTKTHQNETAKEFEMFIDEFYTLLDSYGLKHVEEEMSKTFLIMMYAQYKDMKK